MASEDSKADGDATPLALRADLAKIRFPSGGTLASAVEALQHRFPEFAELEGWLSVPEGAVLFDLATMVPSPLVIIEVGSYRGKSTTALALGARPGVRVYAFDPHEKHVGSNGGVYGPGDLVAFNETMRRANTFATIFPMSCGTDLVAGSWKKPAGLVFIDGDHTYEGCRADADGWIPHINNGGVLALDDVNLEGPKRVMEEISELSDWVVVGCVGKVGLLRRLDSIGIDPAEGPTDAEGPTEAD